MKYLKYILSSVILFAIVSCDAFSDPDLPIPLDETMENTGAFLRIIDVESAAFDILNLNTAAFVFNGEYWDDEDQSLLDNVQFYSNYRAAEDQRPDVGRTLVKTYDAADFGTNDATGWPSQRFEITIAEINDVMGIDGPTENLLGDRYQLDWVLNLTDGRSFTSDEMSPAITGGFFNSPNQRNVDVVAAIPEDEFVGLYQFTQLDAGDFGLVYTTAVFEAEITIDPANTINGRVFREEYLGALGFEVGPRDQPFTVALANDIANNSVTLSTTVGAGLGCSPLGLFVGPEQENVSDFDLDDDSSFIFGLTENVEGDCGGAPTPVRFLVEKLPLAE